DGVMVVNMNMRSDSSDGINNWLSDTISSVFDNVYTVDVSGATNRELFASDNPEMLSTLKSNSEKLEDLSFSTMMGTVIRNLEPYDAGNRILTDDKAPVELLGMNVIDDIIQDELVNYKRKFKEDGIQGLLQ
ncbi:MAG: spermidine synthase, partial [Ruminococcus sp.]|nr:spermidine synthase [Ruminococcus sp.]